MNSLGSRIRLIRKNLGLTMKEFGEMFCPPADKSNVSKWESGKYIPNNERLKNIAALGNTTIEELMKPSNIVEMPLDEYQRLKDIEQKYNEIKDLVSD